MTLLLPDRAGGDDAIARFALRSVFTQTHSSPRSLSRRQPLMGGTATITLVGASADLLDACFALADRCEALWSRFLPSSDVSQLNSAEGRETIVDPLTVTLIKAMRDGVAVTGGDFDPTLLPLLVQIGYAASVVHPERVTTLPASAQAPGNLAGIRVGHAIEGQSVPVSLPVGTTIDPGGIGKGLTADLVCAFALAEGAWGVMAEIGGDIAVAGQAPSSDDPSSAWRLGVEDPFDATTHAAVVRLTAGALVTSSQRKRRFASAAGVNHHLLDPRRAGSAATDVQTVSVIAATGARAEYLTKPGFLRPVQEYLAWLPSVGAAGFIIDNVGVRTASANWDLYAIPAAPATSTAPSAPAARSEPGHLS